MIYHLMENENGFLELKTKDSVDLRTNQIGGTRMHSLVQIFFVIESHGMMLCISDVYVVI